MKFEILTEKEFTKFASKNRYESFYQTVNWGKLKEINGWKSHLVGIKEDNKIIAASMILSKMTPIGKNMFYAPRGFLIDYDNFELLEFFTKEVKKYVKKNKGIFLKIDPYVEYVQRNINGDIVEDGYNNKKAFDNLIKLNYKHFGFNLYQETLQPRWIYTINCLNKSCDDLFMDMTQETRRIIKRNIKNCYKTRELSYDELDLFKDIMENTSERRDFIDRPLSYYQDMYKCLNTENKLKVVVVELHTKEYLESLKNDLKLNEDEYNDRKYKYDNNLISINEKKFNQKQMEIENYIKKTKKNIQEAELLIKEKGEVFTLGGAMFLLFGNEVVALFGGTYREAMKYQSSYTTYWNMICYAVNNGFSRYNFYGITGDFSKDNPLIGLYTFKRDFGGQVVELLGEFDLVIDKFTYKLYKISFKILHASKKILHKIKK